MTPLIDVAEAEEYMQNILHTEFWDAASITKKSKALRESTIIINRLKFSGEKEDCNQENEFPRKCIGTPYAIKWACVEQAHSMLQGYNPEKEIKDFLTTARNKGNNVTTEYIREDNLDFLRHGITSARAWAYLKPFLDNALRFERNS